MRTTININNEVIKEAQALYNTNNRSKAIENAIKDAVRFNKLKELMSLKLKINFDEEYIKKIRNSEINEA